MKFLFLYLLIHFIYVKNTRDEYIKEYSYPYLSTQFLGQYSQNIVVFTGKKNNTKCFASQDIKINDTIFEYEMLETISSTNIILPEEEKITSIIKKYANDKFLQNKFILSFFIYHVITNPYNIPEVDRKLRLYILNLPIEEINPIEFLVDKNNIEKYLLKKEWLENKNNEEIEIINKIINESMDIDINNKTDEDYILFGKIYYFVKAYAINVNEKAIILPFMDSCDIIPYYLHRYNMKNNDNIFIEIINNKIIVKSKLNISQSDQFIYSYGHPLTNDYLLLNQGKIIFNNINDKYIINKNFAFENNNQFASLMTLTNMKKEDILKIKAYRFKNKRFANFTFELLPNKIDDLIYNIGEIYYNKSAIKFFIMILRMCYDELKDIFKTIKEKYKSYEDYLLKIQNEKEISEINDTIMKMNLAKINILDKNVNLAFRKIVELKMKEIYDIKSNYI